MPEEPKPKDPSAQPDAGRAEPRVDDEADREAVEKFIDAALEELCERYLAKFNEGNNGIVLRLRMDDIPPELKEGLQKNGIELGDDKVAKILKIYSGGKGKQEFEMQKKAHELVEAQPDKEKYARVPKPYFYRDFAVGPDAQERIKSLSDKGAFSSGRVEMFMMDYVPGDDVATILYKEVAKRHPKTVDIAGMTDDLPFSDLQDRVFQALDFRAPGGKSRDIGERELEMRKVFAENAEKIDVFLERRGFRIDPTVVSQIENTMNLFHKNGLAFRDGHQRNFMISGDYEAKPGATRERPPQVFVIDYGAATEVKDRPIQEAFKEVEGDEGKGATVRTYPDDFMVARQLKRFTAEGLGQEERKMLDDLVRARKMAERNPRLGPALAEGIESAKAGKPDVAAAYRKIVGTSTMPSEGALDGFLTVAHAMLEHAPEDRKEEVRNAVVELTRSLPLAHRNKVTKFVRVTK